MVANHNKTLGHKIEFSFYLRLFTFTTENQLSSQCDEMRTFISPFTVADKKFNDPVPML
jgi:hypothetical protein